MKLGEQLKKRKKKRKKERKRKEIRGEKDSNYNTQIRKKREEKTTKVAAS